MEGLTLQDALLPRDGQMVWDVTLYVIMFFQIILLIILFDGSLRDVLLVAVSFISAMADKAYVFGFLEYPDSAALAIPYHTEQAILTYVARVAMFSAPLLLAAMTKEKKARPLAILIFLTTAIYTFARWFIQQSGI